MLYPTELREQKLIIAAGRVQASSLTMRCPPLVKPAGEGHNGCRMMVFAGKPCELLWVQSPRRT